MTAVDERRVAELEREVKRLREMHEPGCWRMLVCWVLLVLIVPVWDQCWVRGWTDRKPFWVPDKIPFREWKERNK